MQLRHDHPYAMPVTIARHLRTIERFGALARHIDSHLDDPLDLMTLAEFVGLSRHHLARAYLAYAQETPVGRVRRLRLLRARQQIMHKPQLHMLDVALDAGYDSVAAFTHAFRRQFGHPPTLSRKTHRALTGLRLEALPSMPLQAIRFRGNREEFRLVSNELRARAMACDIDRKLRFGWQIDVENRLATHTAAQTIDTTTGLLHEPLGQSIPGLDRLTLPAGHYAVFSFHGSTHVPSRASLADRILHETGGQLDNGPWLRRCRNTEYLPAAWESRFDLYLPVRLPQKEETGMKISRFILEK